MAWIPDPKNCSALKGTCQVQPLEIIYFGQYKINLDDDDYDDEMRIQIFRFLISLRKRVLYSTGTVNLEIFARILFSQIALKDIFVTLEHDRLPASVNEE